MESQRKYDASDPDLYRQWLPEEPTSGRFEDVKDFWNGLEGNCHDDAGAERDTYRHGTSTSVVTQILIDPALRPAVLPFAASVGRYCRSQVS